LGNARVFIFHAVSNEGSDARTETVWQNTLNHALRELDQRKATLEVKDKLRNVKKGKGQIIRAAPFVSALLVCLLPNCCRCQSDDLSVTWYHLLLTDDSVKTIAISYTLSVVYIEPPKLNSWGIRKNIPLHAPCQKLLSHSYTNRRFVPQDL
jgi:hypothetical protein